jgi:hypothetical protein
MTKTNLRVIQALISFGYTDALFFPILEVQKLLQIRFDQAKNYVWALEKRGFVHRRYRVFSVDEPGTRSDSRWQVAD